MDLTLQQAQQQVDTYIQTVGVRYYNVLTNLGILIEEQGELARLLVRLYGEQSFKDTDHLKNNPDLQQAALADELVDVLWVVLCLANQTGVNLTTAFEKNMQKKTLRDSTRHQQNDKLK